MLLSFRWMISGALALLAAFLVACAQTPSNAPAPERYRCEQGVEFAVRFSGNSATLDGTRGYELLFNDFKPIPDPPNPNSYRNPRMAVEFKLGPQGREAILRYPLLPLVLRCVKDL